MALRSQFSALTSADYGFYLAYGLPKYMTTGAVENRILTAAGVTS
jgi:hypothetical protein